MAERPRLVLVAGDVICDHSYYLGKRSTADSPETRGFRVIPSGGGALLLRNLIKSATEKLGGWETEFGLDEAYESLPLAYHSYSLWAPRASADGKGEVWRAVEPLFGYGPRSAEHGPSPRNSTECEPVRPRATPIHDAPEILVLDDAGLAFREAEACWRFLDQWKTGPRPQWVVLKLTGTLEETPLWKKVHDLYADRLILVVTADQLRREQVRLSRGLSWEATAEDLIAELENNDRLASLRVARHLIVTFRSDAAFWFERAGAERKITFVFDAKRAEGEWEQERGEGAVFGYLSCLTAALVVQLCRWCGTPPGDRPVTPALELGLGSGLAASRELHRRGNGPVIELVKVTKPSSGGASEATDVPRENPTPGFPLAVIAERIVSNENEFASTPISQSRSERGKWTLLDEWQAYARKLQKTRPHNDAALAVAVVGPGALERFPAASFGALHVVDRREMEDLRTLRHLMLTYERGGPQKQPLSIGVFGPPGAGKSFGVRQIAKSILGLDDDDILTFNLSQFDDPAQLIGAFHRVRDRVLAGRTPLVFWDEFDSQEYRWLRHLLAPMQDGVFQDGQITHPVGKCFFAFAGATGWTFDAFGPLSLQDLTAEHLQELDGQSERRREVERDWLDFVLKKGPDFKSRLVGHLDVLGPNRRQVCRIENGRRVWSEDPSDLCCPIRRALFIRSRFGVKANEVLLMDPGLLRALLEVPRYKSGSRSLDFLCDYLKRHSTGSPMRSGVPGPELLSTHVDAAAFWTICERDDRFMEAARRLAPVLHEGYRTKIQGESGRADVDVDFDDLAPDKKRANVAQALRIPGILDLVGLQLVKEETGVDRKPAVAGAGDDGPEGPVRQILTRPEILELLAEAEHNGWMVERMLGKLKYGRVPDELRQVTHNLIVPYSQLAEQDKGLDRSTVAGESFADGRVRFGYVDLVKLAGYRIVPKESR